MHGLVKWYVKCLGEDWVVEDEDEDGSSSGVVD